MSSVLEGYSIQSVIGDGRTSEVRWAQHVETGAKVAVKIVTKQVMMEQGMSYAQNEVVALQRLSKGPPHPHIVRFLNAFQTTNRVWIVTELAQGEELFSLIKRSQGGLGREKTLLLFSKIVSAVTHIHDQRIAHRDLKPSNILVSAKGGVKLVDFGLALTFPRDADLSRASDGKHCGSPHYLAPELFLPGDFNPFYAELWSLGVILFVMISGYVPFASKSASDLGRLILAGKYTMPTDVPEDIREMIHLLLVRNPEERMRLPDLCRHRAFNDYPVLLLPKGGPRYPGVPLTQEEYEEKMKKETSAQQRFPRNSDPTQGSSHQMEDVAGSSSSSSSSSSPSPAHGSSSSSSSSSASSPFSPSSPTSSTHSLAAMSNSSATSAPTFRPSSRQLTASRGPGFAAPPRSPNAQPRTDSQPSSTSSPMEDSYSAISPQMVP